LKAVLEHLFLFFFLKLDLVSKTTAYKATFFLFMSEM